FFIMSLYELVELWVKQGKEEYVAPISPSFEEESLQLLLKTEVPSYGDKIWQKDYFFLEDGITFLAHGSYGATSKFVFEAAQKWQIRQEVGIITSKIHFF